MLTCYLCAISRLKETEDLFTAVSPSEHTLDHHHPPLSSVANYQKITSGENKKRPQSQQQWTDVPLDYGPFSAGQQAFSNVQNSALSPPPPERRLGSLIDSATLGAVEELLAMPKSAAFERGMSRLFKGVKNSAHSIFSSPALTATERPGQEQSRVSSVGDTRQDNMHTGESSPNLSTLEPSVVLQPLETLQQSPPEVLPPPPKAFSPPSKVFSPPPKVFSPPPKVFSPPPKVLSPPAKVLSPPTKVLSPPPKVFSPPENALPPPPKATQQRKAHHAPQAPTSKAAPLSVESHDWAHHQNIQPFIEYTTDLLPASDLGKNFQQTFDQNTK